MMYEVELLVQADADLRGIYEYIAFTLLAPENAGSQLYRLETGILSLEQYPMRHLLLCSIRNNFHRMWSA